MHKTGNISLLWRNDKIFGLVCSTELIVYYNIFKEKKPPSFFVGKYFHGKGNARNNNVFFCYALAVQIPWIFL